MIVEYIRYKVGEGRESEFEDAYKRGAEALGQSAHCERYEVSRCVEQPEHYVVRIEWDSQEGHVSGFRGSQEFRTFFQAVAPYVSDIEEMQHYDVILAAPAGS